MFKLLDGNSEVIIDEKGAYVSNLILNGKKILKGRHDDKLTHGGAAPLIPFANRVKNHTYQFEGKQYNLPQNDGLHSIHGLILDSSFEINLKADNFVVLNHRLTHPGIPSELEIEIRYRIDGNEFTSEFSAKNTGTEKAPITIGAHPYFMVKENYLIDYKEPLFRLNYVDGYFPDGKAEFVDLNNIDFSNFSFDNTFYGGGDIILKSNYSEIEIVRENMPFIVLYNGKYTDGASFAIEPMTAAPDAFNNRIGLKIINPSELLKCKYKIKLLR